MIVVHHLNESRSLRALWLIEELELPYSVERYQRDSKTMFAPAALREIHPLGKAPVIVDGDRTIAESGAITEYLVDRYGRGRLKPSAEADAQRYSYWIHYSEGSLAPAMTLKLIFEMMPKRAPLPLRPLMRLLNAQILKAYVNPQLALHLDMIEGELATHEWFAGEAFSAADIQMAFPLGVLNDMGGLGDRPNILRFLEKARLRPAYGRAEARGADA